MQNYLISSDSFRLIEEQISTIVSDSKNIVTYNLDQNDLQEVIQEASYISFLPDIKYIIVKNADIFSSKKAKENDLVLLENYLENPNLQVVLIFITNNKVDERKKITKLMKQKYKYINIAPLKEYDLNQKVYQIFKNDGYKIDFESVKYISKANLGNYDLIYNEIEKIKTFYAQDKQILLKDIKKLAASSLEDNIFKFINAVIKKDNIMFSYLNKVKLLKQEPVMIISLLAREYRNMYIVKNNQNIKEVCSVLKLQSWQYDTYLKNSYNYSLEELKNLLNQLYELDLKIKKGDIDKYLGLELFLLSLQ